MRIARSDSAVSTIIGAVLILALIITVAAAAKMVYVPDMKKESESTHMQNAIDDMQNLKTQVSTMQAASTTGSGFTTNSPIEMGGGALPVIDPSSSSGTVAVQPAYGNFTVAAYCNNKLITDNNSMLYTRGTAPMGRLVYQANNNYYTDQVVSFEGGMLVLAQYGGQAMISSPPITVTRVVNNPNLTAIVMANPQRIGGSPQTLSSTHESAIKTTVLPSNNVINSDKVTNVTITVQSNYSQLWYAYFDQIMTASGLVNGTNYKLTQPDSQTVSLWIQGSGLKDDVQLSSIDSVVQTQIDGAQSPITPSIIVSSTPTPVPTQVPIASISATPTSGTAPLAVNFQWSGTNSPTLYYWDFGDGSANSGSGTTATHTYGTPGIYTVSLIARNVVGNSTPATAQITVNMPVPVASIYAMPTTGPAPLTVNFQGSGTNSPTSYDWDFGDGSAHGTGATVSHTYATPRPYTVVLVASNAGGNSAPVIATINVSTPVPVASISATPTTGPAPLTVNFQGSGTNSPTSYDWDFGDGSAHGTGPTVSHTYATADTYTVTLIASNAGGNSAPATAQITATRPTVYETQYLLSNLSMSTTKSSSGSTTWTLPIIGPASKTWISPNFAADYTILYPYQTDLYMSTSGIQVLNSVSATVTLVYGSQRTTLMSSSNLGLLSVNLDNNNFKATLTPSSQTPVVAPKGSHLEVTVSGGGLINIAEITVYESSLYPSGVGMNTQSYVSVSDLKLYDTNNNPITSVARGGTLRVQPTVTDPLGATDIKTVTLTAYSPGGTVVYGPTTMINLASDTSDPPAWNSYRNDVAIGSGLSPGTYTVVVRATDANGAVATRTVQIPVT